jgi:hypothetical protein
MQNGWQFTSRRRIKLLPQGKRDQVARNLRLAEELGAKTLTLPGQSVAETIMNYARRHNVTKVIVGKPIRSRWDELLRGSVVDQLVRRSGPIDVYIISAEAGPAPAPEEIPWRPHHPWRRYLWGALLVVAATGLSSFSPAHFTDQPVMIYLLTVVVAATYLAEFGDPGLDLSVLARFLLQPLFQHRGLRYPICPDFYRTSIVALSSASSPPGARPALAAERGGHFGAVFPEPGRSNRPWAGRHPVPSSPMSGNLRRKSSLTCPTLKRRRRSSLRSQRPIRPQENDGCRRLGVPAWTAGGRGLRWRQPARYLLKTARGGRVLRQAEGSGSSSPGQRRLLEVCQPGGPTSGAPARRSGPPGAVDPGDWLQTTLSTRSR